MSQKTLITGDFDLPKQYLDRDIVHLRTPISNEEIIEHLKDVQHYIVGGPEYVDEAIMSQAPNLEHVVVMGTGINSFIDLKAAAKRGIHVDNTPGINADAVAEFALGAVILNLANSFHSQQGLLQGAWYQKPHRTLSETRFGIVGLGDIGSRLASKIKALSPTSEVQYFSRSRKPEKEDEIGLKYAPLERMVQEVDAIVLCVTYNEGSHEIISEAVLNAAKNGIMIFNFSNPKTIDPSALSDALKSGKVDLAYYDGYYDEWIYNKGLKGDKHGLLGLGSDKFIATSHIAAQTHGVIEEIIHQAFDKIDRFSDTTNLGLEENHPNHLGR